MTDKAPFLTAAKQYLKANESSFAPATRKTKAKGLRTIAHDLAMLGIPKPATPKRLAREHILGLLAAWKARGLALTSQHKLVMDLEGFLISVGNPVIDQMRRTGRAKHLSELDLRLAVAAATTALQVATELWIEGDGHDDLRALLTDALDRLRNGLEH